MKRHWCLAPAVACALGVALPARADDDCGAVRDEVSVTLERGYATVRMETSIYHPPDGGTQLEEPIILPDNAAMTGLWIRHPRRSRWIRAGLVEAAQAAKLYGRLTGLSGRLPSDAQPDDATAWLEFDGEGWGIDPGLATWVAPGAVFLQLYPVKPDAFARVKLEFVAALPYREGRYRLEVPTVGAVDCPTWVTVRSKGSDALLLDGQRIRSGTSILQEYRAATLALEPKLASLVSARLSVAQAGGKRVVHWRAAVAPELGTVPPRADVVVIIDASRSMTEHGLATAVGLAGNYLARMSDLGVDGQAQVLSFNRNVREHFEHGVGLVEAAAGTASLDVETANGSDLSAALARAAQWFEVEGREGAARRILLLSDLTLPSAIDVAGGTELIAATGAIAHVGIPADVSAAPMADMDHPWQAAVGKSGGVVWRVGDPRHQNLDEWIRPGRLLATTAILPGVAADRLAGLGDVAAGTDVQWLDVTDHPVRELTVEGYLWARKVSTRVRATKGDGRRLAALVAGRGGLPGLDKPGLVRLARQGNAVSPVTSLIAVEPGAQPKAGPGPEPDAGDPPEPTEPEDDTDPVPAAANPRLAVRWMRSELWKGWRACGLGDYTGTISVELTGREVAAVPRFSIAGGPEPETSNCAWAWVWRLDLPEMFTAPFETWTIEFDPRSGAHVERTG